MKTRKKRSTEAPANVKEFILSVTSAPLEHIQNPLSGFCWIYEKGDFHHWIDLFHHFDHFFEKYVKQRKDLQLEGDFLESQDELPEGALLEILRVSGIIFENCANKYLYRSHENILLLLASTNSRIVISALQTLAALVKKPAQSTRSVRWHGDSVFNGHLFSLSQGWGGKEEGLGLLSCAIEGGCDIDAFELASTLYYEFYADAPTESLSEAVSHSGLQVIHIPNVHMRPENDLLLFKQLVDTYNVPLKLRFSLFTRLRFARAFHDLETRRQFICIRLLAFTALLQSNPDHEDLTAFFVNEPEFVNELVALLQSEDAVPEDIRILAIRALAAQAQDRPRQSNVLNVVSAGGHRGVLPSLVQKTVVSLTNDSTLCSIPFAEALLFLVTVLVSSSAGCAALREAGLIPTLLPLLKDRNPQHIDLVISAVHILEAFMDYSNPAGTLFRDLGGLDDTIMRLQFEVMQVEQRSKEKQTEMEVIDDSTSQHDTLIPYRHRLLLKALLRAIALGTYASGNTSRLRGSEESALPGCLCTIFRHAKEFGGGVFSLAASVMSDMINKDPTCYSTLDAVGLPSAFLDSITAEVLPSSDAVGCIPHALDALCLNHAGLQAVLDSKALECFVKIFTCKAYLKALSGDTPAAIASGLDELMRHAPPLRGPGVDACINILKKIRVIGGADLSDIEIPDTPVPMETDSEQVSQLRDEDKTAETEAKVDSSAESLLSECINNTVQMLETIFQNADTCRTFIEKKGLEELLQLFTLPHLPISFGGSSTAYNIFLTFRAFSSQHASTLAKAVCKVIKEHMKATASSLICMKFSDVESESREKLAKNLSSAECFLSLAAFLVRSLTLMMTEINSVGSDLFEDIGKIHRWVLWQISLLDDEKIESKRDEETASKSAATTGTDDEVRDNEEEPETVPVVRYVSGGGSRSRWGFESEMIPLLPTEQNDRRSRRESMATELLNHVARLGRMARNAAVRTVRGDLESSGNPVDILLQQEHPKHKTAETLHFEMMTRLAAAARGLYSALGKAMTVPSRHRDDVTVSPVAKAVASSLAHLFLKNLEFNGNLDATAAAAASSSSSEAAVSVKCRYLGKVVEDITVVVMDSRRKTCNTVMVNCLYAHGTFKQLLTTFEATSQLLWTSLPMEMETANTEVEKGNKASGESWLLDTLKNYTRLMEYLVTASTLLVPSALAQLLVQPVSGRAVPIPRDPEHFVWALQAQVLEVVLPLWNHPMFSQCNTTFVESICSIIKQIYTGVTDTSVQQASGAGIVGDRQRSSPPDESAISLIVEMGFPRSRAEEALRRVANNRVELAMEWLFNHPEEIVQEEDELARALALSLGNSNDSVNEESTVKGKDTDIEEIRPQLLPFDSMLVTCLNLLSSSNATIFSVADVIVTMCTHAKGEDREKVISFLIRELKLCKIEESVKDCCRLSTISHLLALVLSEDTVSREVAAKNGIVATALDFLDSFRSELITGDKSVMPKWVTALLLVLDFVMQQRPKTDTAAQNHSDELTHGPSNMKTEDQKTDGDVTDKNPWEAILGKPTGYMTEEEQKKTMSIACKLLSLPLSAATAQAILQLCARLTKVHSIAIQFLDAGGLTTLLTLPRNCLFPGFDNVASAIIRHLLEDPQTLQQAMESEIRHTLTASPSRQNNRISPRTFLTTMARVVARNPTIFMQAAAAVCQIEESGSRFYVVLAKDKEKEKEKEKEKSVEKEKEKEKMKAHDEVIVDSKISDTSKPLKGHKKIPQSFSHVMEQLLDIIINFVPPNKESDTQLKVSTSIPTAMDLDEVAVKDKGKGKLDDAEQTEKPTVSDSSSALAKVAFILKLTTDIILMYSASSSVILRRDTETSQGKSSFFSGCVEAVGHGGLLHGILHKLVPNLSSGTTEKSPDYELREKLSSKAVQFLVAICMRSAEGRRRLFSEISKSLMSSTITPGTSSSEVSHSPDKKMRAFVDLLNTILLSHTSSSGGQAPGVSTEMAKGMLEADMVQALTTLLQVIDLDHPESPKLVSGIAKALEALTRAASLGDHMYISDSKKNLETIQNNENGLVVSNGQPSGSPHEDILHGAGGSSLRGDLQVAIRAILVHDDMGNDEQLDHEMGLDQDPNENDDEDDDDDDDDEEDDEHLEAEDEEFMHDAEEVGDMAAAATMSFRIDRGAEDELGEDEDDDEDMDGDAGEEEDEDEQDEDELEDEVALSPPDTDAEDPEHHELEDYDDDIADEDEEEDEWRENRIIGVRWTDVANGFNHIEVLGNAEAGNQDFPMDPFQGMNIDYLFGAFRRPGGIDRRRGSTYRTFDRAATENARIARHPLLNRQSLSGSAMFSVSSPWVSTGGQEVESDASRIYTWYDGTMIDHVGDGLFGDRGVGQDGIFIDFPMLPRMGRRNTRIDGRFSSWADDGQFQGGAVDVALAQAFEDQFVSMFSSRNLDEQPSSRTVDGHASDSIEMNTTTVENSSGRERSDVEHVSSGHSIENPAIHSNETEQEQLNGSSAHSVHNDTELSGQVSNAGLDVHMHDDRAGPVAKDVEAASQDSGGSGATVGESLRSLEVEIGSADGHDETDRTVGSERLDANHPVGVEGRTRQVGSQSSDIQTMDIGPSTDASVLPSTVQDSATAQPVHVEQPEQREETLQVESTEASLNRIDPTFLEALPEDLRAEVLASQQTRTVRTDEHQPSAEDIDPEFLAALPPEIQAEVLAQQQAQRLLQAQQLEGQPVDMDSASIIATFPADLREEVLLTSSESVLSALPPALLAEAQLLRERAMSQLQSRGIFSLSHRPGGRRTSIDIGARGVSAAIDRAVGSGHSFEGGQRPQSGLSSALKKKLEDGKPLVDTAALKAILRLLRLAQPLGKGILQRLLYNLCSHSVTCTTLVELLLEMLRCDVQKYSSSGLSPDGALAHRLYGCQWNVVYARPQLSDGVPPLVSRRILEILTYLAKHQPLVASLLLYFEPITKPERLDHVNEKGKEKIDDEMVEASSGPTMKGQVPLILLLKLLNQPLYSRSSAHLEQVLGLIEVVTTKAGEITHAQVAASSSSQETTEETRKLSEDQSGELNNSISGRPTEQDNDNDQEARPSGDHDGGNMDALTSSTEQKMDPLTIFIHLPSEELRKLCLLLAREGLSDLAYTRASEVLNKIADIAPPHRRLFIIELAEAAQKLSGAAIKELQMLSDADCAQFTTTSMAGAAILRVLLALGSLKASGMVAKENGQDSLSEKDEDECLSVIRDLNATIEPLWQALSTCATKIETRLVASPPSSSGSLGTVAGGSTAVMPPLSPGAQRILPFIESFFVLCDKLRSSSASQVNNELLTATACEIKEIASTALLSESTSMQQRRAEDKGITFVRFADKHRRVLNAFVRQNPGLLEKSLSLLLKTPRLIDFDNKRAYFRSRIRHQHEQQHYAPLRIAVRRAYVLEDSYNQLRMRTPDELKGRLTVQFQGEEGIDAGGLTREWYQLLSRVIFDKGALLFTTVGNESSFQPNPNSVYQTEHLSYFKFVGRVVAKALFDGQLLDVYFTRSFYKHILGVKVTYHDIEAVDPDFYKNLKWVLENTVSDILGLTFSIDADEEKHILYERTEVTDHELIPGGRNIRVTEENKHEYVDLVAEHRLTTAIKPQINAFLEGFNELISRDLISIFNDKELELLISGLPEIDLEDLKVNTEYTGYTSASPVVQWFWEVVRTFSKEDMARLLQFITGTSKVPLEGFQALQGISGPQKFQIHKAYGAPERLPSAHTCFNQLDLPEYLSKEQLQERLLLAIHEASEGFGFG